MRTTTYTTLALAALSFATAAPAALRSKNGMVDAGKDFAGDRRQTDPLAGLLGGAAGAGTATGAAAPAASTGAAAAGDPLSALTGLLGGAGGT